MKSFIFFIYIIIPSIHEINTVHKEKVNKLKRLLYNSTLSFGYEREMIFLLTFSLAACLMNFVYQVFQWHMHLQNT